jgi:hypothetical protein
MAFVVADRIQETGTVSVGTGTVSLAGATNGYKSFVTGIGSGNSTFYCILDPTAFTWEVGIGTVTSGSPNTLSRTTVLSNYLNTTALVSFSTSNTLTVFNTYPAEVAVFQDTYNNGYAPQFLATNGILLNNATVSSSYTIASGNNAMSVGPITVASGQTVTVSSGQRWLVL